MSDEMRWLLTGLVQCGAINIKQMELVEKYFFLMQSRQDARMQKLDDDFWDEEMRYGSDD